MHNRQPAYNIVPKQKVTLDAVPSAPRCYTCGSPTEPYETVNNFNIVDCSACGHKFVMDTVTIDMLKAFYSDEYFEARTDQTIGYSSYLKDEPVHRKNARAILKLAQRHVQLEGARVLDVGCAYGFFLDEAKRLTGNKCDVVGIEFNANAVQYAKKTLGLDVRDQAFEAADASLGKFDLVVSIGTIEHFIDPLDITKKIAGYLKPGGCLIVTTIDTEGKLPFYSLKPPEHLHYFSKRSLTRMSEAAGLSVVHAKTYFSRYEVADLFFRMGAFSGWRIFPLMGRLLSRLIPDFAICIPTNEMIVVAQKPAK